MPINTDLLIAAPMLQDYLVDKDTGGPLSNGIVTMYKDNQRQTYKNWYYQTGTPGAYTYNELSNPLYLSSVGTIQDPYGNDVIPFYYPYNEDDQTVSETYYVTVYSSDENNQPAVRQFTRENFPFVASNSSPAINNPTNRNYILNNVYWRNIGSLDCTDVTNQSIAPSQHDGYTDSYWDIRFIKDVTGAADTIDFQPMTETLDDDITPETYLNFQCNSVQVGETIKCIQYPISLHIATLANVQASIVIQAQNVPGNPNNYLDIQLYQFLGTGALSQPAPVTIQRITLGNTFQKFIIPVIFPDDTDLALGGGGDDAFFLRIQYPVTSVFEINHTKPQIYLSDVVPDNDFDTYDQIESIINSPRTGDFRNSLNYNNYGWVSANDGTIGSASSSATTRKNKDTWPLYYFLWNNFIDGICPVIGGRGASAYDDFSTNKPITLTRNLGRVLLGANPQFEGPVTFTANASTDILTLASDQIIVKGTPVIVGNSGGSLPSPLISGTVYYVSINSLTSTTIKLSTTIENAYSGVSINLTTNGSGTNTLYNAHGSIEGDSTMPIGIGNMPSHNHPGSNFPIDHFNAGSGGTQVIEGFSGTAGTEGVNIASQGDGIPISVIQPSVFQNVFIKL